MSDLRCPKGHPVTPATLSCMKRAGWYWCGKCVLDPEMIAMSGRPMRGAFYSPQALSGTTPPPSQTAPALSSSVAPGIGDGPASSSHEEGGR